MRVASFVVVRTPDVARLVHLWSPLDSYLFVGIIVRPSVRRFVAHQIGRCSPPPRPYTKNRSTAGCIERRRSVSHSIIIMRRGPAIMTRTGGRAAQVWEGTTDPNPKTTQINHQQTMAMMNTSTQWAVALAIVLLALWWGNHHDLLASNRQQGWRSSWFLSEQRTEGTKTASHNSNNDDSSSSSSAHRDDPSSPVLTIYAIGDLHGDVVCARQWVARTNVLKVDKENGEAAVWRDEYSRLVFMGDYVDKGITSKQTVEYVKSLTEQFPHYVTAILGNHEIELLRDRSESLWGGGRAGYYQVRGRDKTGRSVRL
jgi:hypothetical protein